MSVREYIGARYVPVFGRKDEESIQWDNSKPYEPLTIVLYEGNSYTSRQYVPVGIDITNEDFWALTGNYNAQIEQYRREVSNLAGIIPESSFSSENTVKDYIDNSIENDLSNYNIVNEYIGRLYHRNESDRTASACCVLDDNVMLSVISHPDNSESVQSLVYEIDLETGLVTGTYERNLGHCNDMTYNPVTDRVYAVRRLTTDDTNLLVCNPFEVSIASTIDTGKILLGCAFDRITEKQYVYSRNNDTASFEIYEYDYTTNTIGSLVKSIASAEILSAIKHYEFNSTNSGWQGMIAHNGAIFILFSGENLNYLLRVDGEELKAYNINPCVFMHRIAEYEGIDIDVYGNLVMSGRVANEFQPDKYTVFSVANISGHYVWSAKTRRDYALINNRYNIYCDTTKDDNYTIYQTGDTDTPFATAGEAFKLASLNSHKMIKIVNEMKIEIAQMIVDFPVVIEGTNVNSVLNLQANKLEFWYANVYLHQVTVQALLVSGARYRLRFNYCTPSMRNVKFKLAGDSTSAAMVFAECCLILADYLTLDKTLAPTAVDSVVALNNNSNAMLGANVSSDVTFLQPQALLS